MIRQQPSYLEGTSLVDENIKISSLYLISVFYKMNQKYTLNAMV